MELPKSCQNAHNSARPGTFLQRGVVRSPPRAWAGTNAAAALASVRCHRPGRPRGPNARPRRVVPVCLVAARARTHNWRHGRGRQSCSCIRSTSASSRPRTRVVALDQQADLAARRARESRTSAPGRAPRRPARAGAARSQAPHALRVGQCRAARDPVRREEPRRCDLEPRQPEPYVRPGRGRAQPARGRPQAARDRSGQPVAAQAAIDARPRARARPRSRSHKPGRRAPRTSHRSRPSGAERPPDLGVRRAGAGGAGPDARAPARDGR